MPLLCVIDAYAGNKTDSPPARDAKGEVLVLCERITFKRLVEADLAGDTGPHAHKRPIHEVDVSFRIEVDEPARVAIARECAVPAASARQEATGRRVLSEQ